MCGRVSADGDDPGMLLGLWAFKTVSCLCRRTVVLGETK